MKKTDKVLVYLLKGDKNTTQIFRKTGMTNTELSRMKKKGLIVNNGRQIRGKTFIPSTWQLTLKGLVDAQYLLSNATSLEYFMFAMFGKIR